MKFDVIHVVASLDLRHGGPSKSVLGLASGQAKLGARVGLASLDSPLPDSIPENLHVFIGKKQPPHRLSRSHELRTFLQQNPASIIQHHGLWLRPLHYACEVVRNNHARLVISPRGMLEPWARSHHALQKRLAARFVHPHAMGYAHGWHATAEQEAQNFADISQAKPVCIAPNGIDLPDKQQQEVAARHWEHLLSPNSKDCRTALFYSRFHPKKRVLELIELWKRLRPPGWRLMLVGIPETYTVEFLRQKVGEFHDQILVFDGRGAPPPYAVSDLVVFPTHSENFGQVVVEALAWNVPVLVTDQTPWSSLPEIGAGWWVKWEQFSSVLHHTTQLRKPDLKTMGECGHKHVQINYTWKNSSEKLLTFYKQLLSN